MVRPGSIAVALGISLGCLLPSGAPAGDRPGDECLMCHEDADLTGTRAGREFSAYVDPEAFAASIHADLGCVACHLDVDPDDLPHADDLEPVDCANCHDVSDYEASPHAGIAGCADCHTAHAIRAEGASVDCGSCHVDEAETHAGSVHGAAAGAPGASCTDCHGGHPLRLAEARHASCAGCHPEQARDHERSLHGRAAARGDALAPDCVTCHGTHRILSHRHPDSPTRVMNIPLLCGQCHHEGTTVSLTRDIPQARILENYSLSIHGRGLFEQGLTVTAVCTSCHTSHEILPHTDPDSSIHRDNVARTCERCHGQIEEVHRKVIEGRLWREQPEKIPVCVDCHAPHKIRKVLYPAGMANQDCLRCHRDPELTAVRDGETVSLWVDEDAFNATAHGTTACAQCHTEVTASLERPCETQASPVDCGTCHAETVNQYRASIHGTLAASGDPDAPRCLDCHLDEHAIVKKTVPTSPTFSRNVPQLCARCHRIGEKAAARIVSEVPDIVQSYMDSIHGKGLLDSGLVVTATCANCHTAHGELPPDDPRSTVNHDNLTDTCAQCHLGIAEIFRTSIHQTGRAGEDHELPTCNSCHSSHTISRTDQAGFRTRMMNQCGNCHEAEAETFFDTFHGKVSRLGSEGAAKCYDCHGTHGILPASDPRSTLGRDNVVATCGQCHPGSHRRFAGYLTHATHHDPDKYPWLFWSFWLMTALLVGTLTFAVMHTLAWLVRLFLTRHEWQSHKARAKAEGQLLYRRFNKTQRMLHLWMLLSFFTLAITGMMLKFSYTGWAQKLAWLLGGFETTGTLHRTGAIVLLAVFFLHLREVVRRKRRKKFTWKQMLTGAETIVFTLTDARQVLQSIKWFFGLGPRPKYGRFTYWEKFDYFAVFWGVLVIGSTGFVLWFPELFTRLLPGWSVNVATIIHSDEALLAVGFIFTIHFFNTHFRPDKFPMDPVIFTGRVTLDELKYDKPAEYAELVADGRLERHLVKPMLPELERSFRIFGFIALAVGLTLIALIVYAMLFGYR